MEKAKLMTGYKDPPFKHRWRKGQSGNPFGRPKKETTFKRTIADILVDDVTVSARHGRKRRIHPIQAGLINLCREALDGSPTKFFQCFAVLETLQDLVDQQVEKEHTRSESPAFKKAMKQLNLKVVNDKIVPDDEALERALGSKYEELAAAQSE